jgi:hypothetical protein
MSLRKTVREGASNPNTVITPTQGQQPTKSRRTSAIERGVMSFGLRSNNGKELVPGLNGLNGLNPQHQKSIAGIRVETETYMMSDMADDGGVTPVKSAPIWFDS